MSDETKLTERRPGRPRKIRVEDMQAAALPSQCCANCANYRSDAATKAPGVKSTGWCHRYPPAVGLTTFVWPVTLESDWCGEWKDMSEQHQ